jgi:DNA-binding NarL/FixJ family response regulator
MTAPLTDGPVRVVLVDDHEMVIEGLKAMLAPFKNRVRVVGEAVGVDKALSVIASLKPDIVLCDVRMQGASGLDVCRAVRERDPERKVILLSVYDDEQYLFQALRVGASGYLLKGISSDELVRSIPGSPPARSTPRRGCSATSSGRAHARV